MMPPTVILPYTSDVTTAFDIDWIARCLHKLDREIRLLAFDSSITPIALADSFSSKTLTVTLNNNPPSSIFDFVPGPKFFAPGKSKLELITDLINAGIKVPHTEIFSEDFQPDEVKFGSYITIKTTAPGTSRAHGVHVFRTGQFDTLRDKLVGIYRQDIASGHMPLLQQYIPTGSKPRHTTVSTFLGAPIACYDTIAPEPFDLKSLHGLAGGEATSNFRDDRTRTLSNDEDVLTFAKEISTVFPETSVLGIDIIRCADSGELYCIEANLGHLCVLSAPICNGLRQALGAEAVHSQFMSYQTIARRIFETIEQIQSSEAAA